MIGSPSASSEHSARGELLRWAAAFVVVLAAHGGGAFALMMERDRGEPAVDAGPAILVEFAAVPVAAAPPRTAAPGPEQMQSESTPSAPAPAPEPPKESEPAQATSEPPGEPVSTAERPRNEQKPEEQQVKAEPEQPSPIPDVVQPQEAEVAVAAVPPPPPPRESDEPKKEPKQKKAAPQQRQASIAAPATTAPTRAAARSASLVNWKGRLALHLQRHKRYPAAAQMRREQGTVQVQFTVDRNGRVVSSAVVQSSGHTTLDQETLALLRRAEPFPKPPADVPGNQFSFSVPVRYNAR